MKKEVYFFVLIENLRIRDFYFHQEKLVFLQSYQERYDQENNIFPKAFIKRFFLTIKYKITYRGRNSTDQCCLSIIGLKESR